MHTELQSRRRLITGAAAGALAVVATARPQLAQAQAAIVKRAPLNTPIASMMSPEAAKLLSSNAASATKGDLVALRAGVRGIKGKGPSANLSVTDVESIEKAFDSHEFAAHSRVGYKVAAAPLGMSTAAAGNVEACCCCCPCCSTAAAVRP